MSGIGAVGGLDNYDLYKKPIDSSQSVNPFAGGSVGGSGAPSAKQPIGIQERELDQNMLAQKAQGFQVGLGGTNNPVDPITGEPCKMFIG